MDELVDVKSKAFKKIKKICRLYNLEYNEDKFEILVENEFENICLFLNRDTLPNEVINVLSKRVVGHFMELNINENDNSDNDTSGNGSVVTKIQEYDTTIEFSDKAANDKRKEKLAVAKSMQEYGKDLLYRYRRIVWN